MLGNCIGCNVLEGSEHKLWCRFAPRDERLADLRLQLAAAERRLSVLETTRIDYIRRMSDRVQLIETDCGAMVLRGEGCTIMSALEDAANRLDAARKGRG